MVQDSYQCPVCKTPFVLRSQDYDCCKCSFPLSTASNDIQNLWDRVFVWANHIWMEKKGLEQQKEHLQSQLQKKDIEIRSYSNQTVAQSFFEESLNKLEQRIITQCDRRFNELITKLDQGLNLQLAPSNIENQFTELEQATSETEPHTSTSAPPISASSVEQSASAEALALFDQEQASLQTQTTFDAAESQPDTASVSYYPIPDWLEQFNHNPEELIQYAIEVATAQGSLSAQRLSQTGQPTVFEKKSGNYWVIAEGGDCYLVPKGKFKLNPHNLDAIQLCFDLNREDAAHHSNFIVISPAIVMPIEQDQWELVERGRLEFKAKE